MIQIYLCEDEKIQLEFWKRELERYIKSANIRGKIVSAHQNPKEILEDVEQESYENVQRLFFIDIQMLGYDMDGFGLAKKLRKKRVIIIWYLLQLKMIWHIKCLNIN